jgi:Galactose oxidase, central domain
MRRSVVSCIALLGLGAALLAVAQPVGAGAPSPTPTWTKLSPATSPPGRYNVALAYDPATSQLVLFGGYGCASSTPCRSGLAAHNSYFNDTWLWTGTTWAMQSPATSPSPRSTAAMAYDPATRQLLLFGGTGAHVGTIYGDTWDWNGSDWVQLTPATSPGARYGASLAYDQATHKLILFGGKGVGTDKYLNDTWSWDGSTWSRRRPATSPPVRRFASMAYDAATSQLVLFGGNNHNGNLGDTWLWSATNWVQQSPATSPPPRYSAATAYDPAIGQLVLFGGESGNSYAGDTWVWTGSSWSHLSLAQSPALRIAASVAYNPVNDGLILFGGYSSKLFGDTWLFGAAAGPQIPPSVSPGNT